MWNKRRQILIQRLPEPICQINDQTYGYPCHILIIVLIQRIDNIASKVFNWYARAQTDADALVGNQACLGHLLVLHETVNDQFDYLCGRLIVNRFANACHDNLNQTAKVELLFEDSLERNLRIGYRLLKLLQNCK